MYHNLIVAMCICNGGQFLRGTLEGIISRIKDINAIHILDGTWEHSGYAEINSTDDTESIIQSIDTKYGDEIRIIYEKSDHVFHNPSDKRNYQLKMIEELFEIPYTVLWWDDDEELRFKTGLEEIWIKDVCAKLARPALIDTYAYNSDTPMHTARLIPGGCGIHWHSERNMCLHDSNCQVIIDWTPKQSLFHGQLLVLKEIFIVNKWNNRDQATLQKRKEFNLHEIAELEKKLPCTIRRV